MTVLIFRTGSDIHALEKLSRTCSVTLEVPVRVLETWFWIWEKSSEKFDKRRVEAAFNKTASFWFRFLYFPNLQMFIRVSNKQFLDFCPAFIDMINELGCNRSLKSHCGNMKRVVKIRSNRSNLYHSFHLDYWSARIACDYHDFIVLEDSCFFTGLTSFIIGHDSQASGCNPGYHVACRTSRSYCTPCGALDGQRHLWWWPW